MFVPSYASPLCNNFHIKSRSPTSVLVRYLNVDLFANFEQSFGHITSDVLWSVDLNTGAHPCTLTQNGLLVRSIKASLCLADAVFHRLSDTFIGGDNSVGLHSAVMHLKPLHESEEHDSCGQYHNRFISPLRRLPFASAPGTVRVAPPSHEPLH